MYIVILFFTTFLLYLARNYKPSFVLYFYCCIPLLVLSSLQFEVGTDYHSYVNIYNSIDGYKRFLANGEYVFGGGFYFLKLLDAPSQSIFMLVSMVNFLMFSFFLVKLRREKIIVWVFFFIWFCVTGVYQNQMNGLRQYLVVFIIPVVVFYISERNKVAVLFFSLLSVMCHISFLIMIPVFMVASIPVVRKNKIVLFIISLLFFYVISYFVYSLADFIPERYLSYLQRSEEGMNYLSVLTKLYYIPVFAFAAFLASNKKNIISHSRVFDIFITISFILYWSFIPALNFDVLGRVSQYSMFFYAFPVYLVAEHVISQRYHILLVILILYLMLPFFLKVTLFAKNEYIYRWII